MRRGIDEDLIDRARQPLLESFENMLKSLGGWMSLADRAQSEADRLGRYSAAPGILKGFTAADIHAAVNAYLTAGDEVELLVVPQGEIEAASAE
jgi:zinc protease